MSYSVSKFLGQNKYLHVGMATDLLRALPTAALRVLSHEQIDFVLQNTDLWTL